MTNPTAFFAALRKRDSGLFGTSLSQVQVNGLNAILHVTEGQPISYRAYMLATPYLETARTMRPITEFGRRSYFDKYEPGTKIGKMLGNTQPGDGYLFRGRGYVQLTGRANYARAGAKLGVMLEQSPDLALLPDIAAEILLRGMLEGWFTGKKLSDYLPVDYLHARRIINGMDRAGDIAGYAVAFERALTA